MCCFCKKSATYSPQLPYCDYNSGCVKPIKSQCCCGGYIQNGWGQNCGSSSRCGSGANSYSPCGCGCKCNKPKCQPKCDNSSL